MAAPPVTVESLTVENAALREQLQRKMQELAFLHESLSRRLADVETRHNQLVNVGSLPEIAAVRTAVQQIHELPADMRGHVLQQMEIDAEASLAFIRLQRRELAQASGGSVPAGVPVRVVAPYTKPSAAVKTHSTAPKSTVLAHNSTQSPRQPDASKPVAAPATTTTNPEKAVNSNGALKKTAHAPRPAPHADGKPSPHPASTPNSHAAAAPRNVIILRTPVAELVKRGRSSNAKLLAYIQQLQASSDPTFSPARFQINRKAFFTCHRATTHLCKGMSVKDPSCFAEITQFETQVVCVAAGYVRLYTGGWYTGATRTVLNWVLEHLQVPERVVDAKGKWFVDTPAPFESRIPFLDGIQIPRGDM